MTGKPITLALVGNPNCGKSTLFNALTGARQRVGNWPGVTVEKKSGEYSLRGELFEVTDLPGTYSLDVIDHEISLDEQIARDYIQAHQSSLIINIVDASNLERNLYLTTQLAETGVSILIALNMIDVAESKGIRIDAEALSRQLDCPVIPIAASTGRNIDALKEAIREAGGAHQKPASSLSIPYDPPLEEAIRGLSSALQADDAEPPSSRWLAIGLLEGEHSIQQRVKPELAERASRLAEGLGEDLDIRIADARYTFVNQLANRAVFMTGRVSRDLSQRIDRWVLDRFLGIPLFLLLMYLMFLFTINIGGAFIDFFDQFTGALLVDGLAEQLTRAQAPPWVVLLMAQGVGGGIQVVATFVPIIGFLFLFLSLLEDSGYMSRAAFVMDRFMRWLGLPGKSFVPLIVGFGCNVPAIMATRTLEHHRDRLMTIAMAPFMSCGARLPVYVLFAAAFFPESGQNVVFGLYLIGIVVAILTGLALKQTLLEGESMPFIMELPPYHLPSPRGILIHAWGRLKEFIVRAGRVIVPMVLILNTLNAIGTDGHFGHENSRHSLLAEIGRTISPAFHPFGLDEENWPAAVGIFTGILAKEAIVGTLNAAYTSMTGEAEAESEPFKLGERLQAAIETIPTNLHEALSSALDPMGIDIGDLRDQAATAQAQAVSMSTFGAMAKHFKGSVGAFAYLLFILLYMPCTAAIAAIYQEAGVRWATFVALWTTGLGYGVATLYYQIANWSTHPADSAIWTVGILATLTLTLLGMRRHAQGRPAHSAHP